MLNRLKLRLPDAENDALLNELLTSAGEIICAYTGRIAVPDALECAQVEIAAVLFNRMGMEGEREHTEGSVRRSVDGIPQEIRSQLNPYRLAKAVEM